MGFLFENKSSLLFLLGVVIMIVILMRRWNRYYRRQQPSRSEAQQSARAAALREPNDEQPLMDAPPELLRWQVEMHDVARDLKGELDTKIAVLQRLIIDARQEADRLDAIIRQAEGIDRR